MHFLSRHSFAAAVFCLTTAGAAVADTISIDFNSFATGNLPGGADARTAGNGNQWYVPDNAATYGAVVTGQGRGGSQALMVGNRGNGNDGVIDNVKSGKLLNAAGESSSGALMTHFQSSFWFRTAATGPVANFEFKTESWGNDRTSWLGFFNGSNGGIQVESSGLDLAGNWTDNVMAGELSWNTWYRVVTDIVFAEGAGNDVVTYSIFDESNGLMGSLANNTWEQGQRVHGYNGGNQVAVDAIGFQSRYSPVGNNGAVYIDDVTWSSNLGTVPEPAGIALVLTAGLAALGASRRRKPA